MLTCRNNGITAFSLFCEIHSEWFATLHAPAAATLLIFNMLLVPVIKVNSISQHKKEDKFN